MGRANNQRAATAGASMRRAGPPSSIHGHGPQTGLPRPWLPYRPNAYQRKNWGDHEVPQQLPVSWMTGSQAKEGMWTGFDEDSVAICRDVDYDVCGMCGEPLGETKVYGRLGDPIGENKVSGTGMHPKCALITYQYCPHFKNLLGPDRSFRLYTGPGHGLTWDQMDYDENGELNNPDLDESAAPISLDELKELSRRQAAAPAPTPDKP